MSEQMADDSAYRGPQPHYDMYRVSHAPGLLLIGVCLRLSVYVPVYVPVYVCVSVPVYVSVVMTFENVLSYC